MKNILAYLTSYKAKTAQLKQLTEQVETMKKELNAYAKENGIKTEKGFSFVCGQYTVTITECTRTDLDKKRLASEHPELIPEYTTKTTYEKTIVG